MTAANDVDKTKPGKCRCGHPDRDLIRMKFLIVMTDASITQTRLLLVHVDATWKIRIVTMMAHLTAMIIAQTIRQD